MAVVRLSGHDEKTGALELLRLFFGASAIHADGSLQGGAPTPLITSCFQALPDGFCRVETCLAPDAASHPDTAGATERLTRTMPGRRVGERPEPMVRREIKRQLYDLLSRLTGRRFPYGSLTGVRPTRLAAEQLAAGLDADAVWRHLELAYGVAPEKARLLTATARNEQRLLASLQPERPLLYVHIPFCPTRCSYCSFTCETANGPRVDLDAYADALVSEIRTLAPHFRQPPAALYIGGGTPTVLSAAQLSRLLDGISASLPQPAGLEFTVEAGRADTIDAEKLAIIRAAGARRICINPQTLQDRTLVRIGRRHTRAQWLEAFHLARAAGFPIINADLIAGLPGERPADFLASLADLVQVRPENITIHTLAFKRKSELTRTARERAIEQDVRMSADQDNWESALEMAAEWLELAGYEPYYLYRQKDMIGGLENTGYALPGTACRYNVGMMSDERTVIGIGAGAMSKYHDAEGWLRRLPATRDPGAWLRGREAAAEQRIRLLFS